MQLSKKKTEKLLKRIRRSQGEHPSIEVKEALNLKSNGDRATFIRHITALANTDFEGYLLIGIENKTWKLKGIPIDSPLRDSDRTQQQMNQILRSKTDPPLNVCYCTVCIEETVIGLVGVGGKNPPYVIAIGHPRYGGEKSRGGSSYIKKGVIYVRHGANSVIADRQSKIIEVVERKRDMMGLMVSLGFIAALVGAGVGAGASALNFADLVTPIILGCIWGAIIGWLFNKRLTENLGRLPNDWLGKAVRALGGPAWGFFIGMAMSYGMADTALNRGDTPHPVLMGGIIGPIAAFIFTFIAASFNAFFNKVFARWL
jgi:hypothetical protein